MDLELLTLELELSIRLNILGNFRLKIQLAQLNQIIFYPKICLGVIKQVIAWNLTIQSKRLYLIILYFIIPKKNMF
jgi:hypothetical protein